MRARLRLALLGAALLAPSALGAADPYAPCAACHGDRGQGKEALAAPPLAGQHAGYLKEQLENFRRGRRGWHPQDRHGQIMAAAASSLDPAQLEPLLAAIAAFDTAPPAAPGAAPGPGAGLYRDHCGDCHGQRAQGSANVYAPNLAILGGAYVLRQLRAYRAGWRGDAAHGTTRAQGMRSIAAQFGDEQPLQAIADYLDGLRPAPAGTRPSPR